MKNEIEMQFMILSKSPDSRNADFCNKVIKGGGFEMIHDGNLQRMASIGGFTVDQMICFAEIGMVYSRRFNAFVARVPFGFDMPFATKSYSIV